MSRAVDEMSVFFQMPLTLAINISGVFMIYKMERRRASSSKEGTIAAGSLMRNDGMKSKIGDCFRPSSLAKEALVNGVKLYNVLHKRE